MSDISISIVTVDVLGNAMEVHLFESASDHPLPGVVLAQHIPVGHTGVENDTFTLRSAERLAAAGYAVAVPFVFHWWDKQAPIEIKRDESRDDWMVADMAGALSLLGSRPNVDADRIGVVGHCWGGRIAWLAACHLQSLKACAVFYGGRIKLAMGDSPPPITLADRIACPVIGFFGNDDSNPTPADVDDYERALAEAGVRHVFYRYDDAGHAFQNFPSPDRYRHEASEDAWSRLLEFLDAELA
jgi:carboxymethylenebutenolidase